MIHPIGSYVENYIRQTLENSSEFVSNIPQQTDFNLNYQQYGGNQVGLSTDWRKSPEITYYRQLIRNTIPRFLSPEIRNEQVQTPYNIPTFLEYLLFSVAASKDEYMNRDTLKQRVQALLSVLTVDELPNLSDSGGPSNLKASSNSISSYHPQQNPNDYSLVDLVEQRDYSEAIQNSNSMGFQTANEILTQSELSDLMSTQYVPRNISYYLNIFPTLTSYLYPEDIRKYQSQELDFQKNQSGSCFGVQCEQCCHMFPTRLANDVPYGNTEAMLHPPKRQKMEPAFGVSSVNYPCSNQWNNETVFQPYETPLEVWQQSETPYSDVPQCNVEQITNLVFDFTGISQTENNVMDDPFGQIFKSGMFPSKGLEAGQISLEPDPQIYGVTDINSLIEIGNRSNFGTQHTLGMDPIPIDVEDIEGRTGFNHAGTNAINNIRFNSSMHTLSMDPIPIIDVEDIKGIAGFNHAGTNAIKKVSEPKAYLEKQTKSSHSTVNEIKSNVIDDIFAQTFESEMTPSKSLEAGQKLVEPDRSYGVTESSNLMEIGSIGSNYSMHTLSMDPILIDVEDIEGRTEFSQAGTNDIIKLSEPKADQEKQTKSSNTTVYEIKSNVIDDAFGQTFQSEMIPSKGLKVVQIFEEPDLGSYGVTESSNSMEIDIRSNSSMHTLSKDPIPIDVEDIQGRTEFNQVGTNAIEKVSEPKADEEKQPKSSNATVNVVSLTELFTCDQIEEHIISLRKQSVQGTTEEVTGIAANTCQLCAKEKLFFSPVPIYCSCCGIRIKRNTNYFCRKEEEFDAQSCFCSVCFKNSKGGCITFNETSVCKTLLERKKNDEVLEEGWVQCNKCKRWQHQICALYNNKRDLDCSAEYICPLCRLEEIKNGMHVPLPKTAYFGAKDLPRTTLSDHIEKRLFEHLLQERAEWANVEGNENLDEVLAAENLSVREVLSVDKQLKVKKQFVDILSEETYPAEFPYRSRVILLFQQIEGVDVCIFAMYAQEFGSECGYPNQRCVYISYLDSVKYFRPQRVTISGEALRTFVYHEILIGYLDFCKKQGFTTCYIWACPPLKGDDYILYCHPETQKTPRNDKLRHWYHSMLRKASEENVVVGLTNIYDHLFVPTGKWDSKVTASRLPYFDGDYWSGTAMELAKNIEKDSGGDYEKKLKKVVTNRALKAMGHVNPSKGTAKEILVMQKLGQLILPAKEDFIVAHLQHSCMHCREVMVSGKRWFCTECKKFQECERCHTSDVHTSINGEMHTLCQVLVDDVPFNTKENDIILQNALFEDRHKFLSFCQKNQYEFGTLRRAKYSSMMILHNLKSPTAPCLSEKQDLKQDSDMMREMLEALQHASQCHSTRAQPCTNKNCLQVKKLLSHATRCTTRASGGCQNCKYTWKLLTAHSRNCKDSECCMPRCLDLKKSIQLQVWKATEHSLIDQ